jgi:ABC-type nitrate/sulfonate/bicarbonate transport system permease component
MADRWTSRLVGLLSLVTVLAVWEFVARYRLVNPVLMPAPSTIADTLGGLLVSGEFLGPLVHTIAVFTAGYAIGCLLGIGIGLWMGCSRAAYGVLEPLVELLRPIPKSALVPALFLFLGIGKVTMVTVVAFGSVFPVLINTLQGVRDIDPVLLDTARTFQCTRRRAVLSVILPAALPSVLTGMKVSLGLGVALAVLAEMLAGENGLGFVILDTQRAFQIREMYAWVVILAVFGVGLSLLFDKIEQHAAPWRGR